jgi:hypothetical protein
MSDSSFDGGVSSLTSLARTQQGSQTPAQVVERTASGRGDSAPGSSFEMDQGEGSRPGRALVASRVA